MKEREGYLSHGKVTARLTFRGKHIRLRNLSSEKKKKTSETLKRLKN